MWKKRLLTGAIMSLSSLLLNGFDSNDPGNIHHSKIQVFTKAVKADLDVIEYRLPGSLEGQKEMIYFLGRAYCIDLQYYGTIDKLREKLLRDLNEIQDQKEKVRTAILNEVIISNAIKLDLCKKVD